jgi:DNA primase
MLDKIVESCRFLLNNYPEAHACRTYLDSRLNEKSQERFQFGYFPDTNNIQVLNDLVGKEHLKTAEMYYSKIIEDSLFPRIIDVLYFENHPLIMPFRNAYGEIVALVGRSLLDDRERASKKIDKYKYTKNTANFRKGHYLFGLFENKQSIVDQNLVYVVEGQLDVVKAMEIGFTNIIALGTCHMNSYQFSVISRYTDNIILLLDNDDGGEKGRKSAVSRFGSLANIQNFYIPDGYKDIDEYITKTNIGSYEEVSFIVKG